MAAGDIDKVTVTKGFKVEIAGKGQLPCKAVNGGQQEAEQADGTTGGSQHQETTPGHSSISDLVMEVYLTPKQKIAADIAKEICVSGKQELYDVTVTELAKDKSPTKTTNYFDCLFQSLDFPKVQAGSGEVLCETLVLKPQRMEVS